MNEELAIKISNALNGVCPAFERRSDGGSCEWHKCKCKVDGGACTCVWHRTDRCKAGTWEHLAFAKKHNEKRIAKQNKVLEKVRQVINQKNNEFEPIKNRWSMLDL